MATQDSNAFVAIRTAIIERSPFCQGIVDLEDGDATIFYKLEEDKSARWVDLARASEDDLNCLTKACQPATFGLNDKDVLDETYRKAGKMDLQNFSTKLDLDKLNIVSRVRKQILEGGDEGKDIIAELYKLNVYGKDSFFKSHKDTPRGESMFGSLVVVFPTPHEGGALVLRHFGQEWTFDSASLIGQKAEACIAYIAFYSDVDHEVASVTSGYRVTLTYNLFLDATSWDQNIPSSVEPVAPDGQRLSAALSAALDDPTFLPKGGYIGFGLHFKYPVKVKMRTALKDTAKLLKGTDAVINRICRQHMLKTTLNAVYKTDEGLHILVDEVLRMGQTFEAEDIMEFMSRKPYRGRVIYGPGETSVPLPRYLLPYTKVYRVWWVTPLTAYSHFLSTYTAHGNEYTTEYIYGDLCIVAKIGKYGNRQTA